MFTFKNKTAELKNYKGNANSLGSFTLPFRPPKTRASKIILFKHYLTDAPV